VIAAVAGAVVAGGGAALAVARPVTRAQRWAEGRQARWPRLASDLAAEDRSLEAFVRQAVAAIAAGALIGAVMGTLANDGVIVVGAGAIWGAVLGWGLARRELARRAEAARVRLRQAAVELAELVALGMAGSLATTQATQVAAGACDPGVRERILGAVAGVEPGAALSRLGTDTAVAELQDLGRQLSAAATKGAQAREGLEHWAKARRQRDVAELEAAAAKATEGMVGPTALTVVGYMVLIGAPAVAAIGTGLGHGNGI
jgi:hypothetical protein